MFATFQPPGLTKTDISKLVHRPKRKRKQQQKQSDEKRKRDLTQRSLPILLRKGGMLLKKKKPLRKEQRAILWIASRGTIQWMKMSPVLSRRQTSQAWAQRQGRD